MGATTKGQEDSEKDNAWEDFHLVGAARSIVTGLCPYVRVPWQAVEFYAESMDPDKSIAVAGYAIWTLMVSEIAMSQRTRRSDPSRQNATKALAGQRRHSV
jgi:hypothetical protein